MSVEQQLELGPFMVAERMTLEARRKTPRYRIINKKSGDILGWIEWYGAWRQFTFNPSPQCVFNKDCLGQLGLFLERLNNQHRNS